MNLINFININEEGEYSYSPKIKKGVKTPCKKEKGEYTPYNKNLKKKKGHNGQKRARMSFYEEF